MISTFFNLNKNAEDWRNIGAHSDFYLKTFLFCQNTDFLSGASGFSTATSTYLPTNGYG